MTDLLLRIMIAGSLVTGLLVRPHLANGASAIAKTSNLRYAIIEIGPENSYPFKISNSGHILYGIEQQNPWREIVIRWGAGISEALSIPDQVWGSVKTMNNQGVAVGFSDVTLPGGGSERKGVVWRPYNDPELRRSPPGSILGESNYHSYEISDINDGETLFGVYQYALFEGNGMDFRGLNNSKHLDTAKLIYVEEGGITRSQWSGFAYLPFLCNNVGGSIGWKYGLNYGLYATQSWDLKEPSAASSPLGFNPIGFNDDYEYVSAGWKEQTPFVSAWHSSAKFLGEGAPLGMATKKDYIVGSQTGYSGGGKPIMWEREKRHLPFHSRRIDGFVSPKLERQYRINYLQDVNDFGWIIAQADKYALDNNGQRIAGSVRAHCVLLLPVEIIDSSLKPATELKIGKLTEDGVIWSGGSRVPFNPDKDPDRFYIRIPGGAYLGSTKIKVATIDNPEPTLYNDAPTFAKLYPSGSDLISRSMLLTSNDIDDIEPVPTLGDGGIVSMIGDEQEGDRTHKIQLGGLLALTGISINNAEFNIDAAIPVKIKKTLQVKVTVLRNKPLAQGGAEVQSLAKVGEYWRVANEVLAQIGLKVDIFPAIADPPATGLVNFEDGLEVDNSQGMTLEFERLLEYFATPSVNGDVCFLYMRPDKDLIISSGLAHGVAHSQNTQPQNKPGLWNSSVVKAYVSTYGCGLTTAHELCHILGISAHTNIQSSIMAVAFDRRAEGKITDSRRIDASREAQMQRIIQSLP